MSFFGKKENKKQKKKNQIYRSVENTRARTHLGTQTKFHNNVRRIVCVCVFVYSHKKPKKILKKKQRKVVVNLSINKNIKKKQVNENSRNKKLSDKT